MMRGQLFHNEPQPGGRAGGFRPSEWVLKLSFWVHDTDLKRFPNGTIQPMFFNLSDPASITASDSTSLLGRSAPISTAALMGCRSIKGMGKAKGTRLIENQVVAISAPRSDNEFASRTLVIAEGSTRTDLTDPYVVPADKRRNGEPALIWTDTTN
jgi:hypothetical protein